MKKSQEKKALAILYLREYLSPGSTVWVKVNTVSRSGMYFRMDCYVPIVNESTGKLGIYRITHLVADATERHLSGKGVKVAGFAADMYFELAFLLFGDGYALKHQVM